MAYNQLGTLASGILQYEFDFITGGSAQASELLIISGTLSGLIGELNTLINQNFGFTTGSDISPSLRNEERSILEELYIRDNNTKQARKLLRGIYDAGSSSSIVGTEEWTELREGDTTIRRSAAFSASSAKTRIETARYFKELAREADDKIKDLVYKYNLYGAVPRQVAGDDGYTVSGQSTWVY